MRRLRTLILVGTRPEAIKLAPLIKECRLHGEDIETRVCLTGQHREMLAQVCDYFEIQAESDLNLMRPNQSLEELTSRCLLAISKELDFWKPDHVVAQGDTTTVLCGALAAFYKRIPFLHVEAGLRSGDLEHPWPEEFNRRTVSMITSIHCAPTTMAANNLRDEGIPSHAIHVTGNTVIDALLLTASKERQNTSVWQSKHKALENKRTVLITGHRRENFGPGFQNICAGIAELARRYPEVMFVYPVHLNPSVQKPVHSLLSTLNNVILLDPVPYPEFVWLMDRSTLILTDSGGVQEEAPSLGKPVLVLRQKTERPEGIKAGCVELVGTSTQTIVDRVSLLLTSKTEYAKRSKIKNPEGDGQASRRIVELLLNNPQTNPAPPPPQA